MQQRRFKCTSRDRPVTAQVLLERGWTETAGEDWSLHLDDRTGMPEAFRELRGRRLNHLPGTIALGMKEMLHRTLRAARLRLEDRGDGGRLRFVPPTFLIPDEEPQLLQWAAREPGASWIEKPRSGARGEGIRLLRNALDATRDFTTLVQRYLDRPHLIDGYKYTLRVYVLITAADPLTAWIFDDGFCKLASQPFSLEGEARFSLFRHLTNPDVLQADPSTPVSSRNLTHREYRALIPEAAQVFAQLQTIAAETLAAARGALRRAIEPGVGDGAGSYELLGFDFTVDADLRPWLLEVNLSPSLSVHADASTPKAQAEDALKRRLAGDLFALIDVDNPPRTPALGELRAHHDAMLARRGGFAALLPGDDPFQFLGGWSARDLALAAGDRAFRAQRASALPLEDGLVLQADSMPELAALPPLGAFVWSAAADGLSISGIAQELAEEVGAESAAAQVHPSLALFAGEGALVPHDAPDRAWPAPRLDPIRWNRETRHAVDGFTFALRLADAQQEELVLPTLAAWRCAHDAPLDGALSASLVDGFVQLEDELGFRVELLEPALLPAAVHTMALRRAAQKTGLAGVLRAIFLMPGCLILGAPEAWEPALTARSSISSREPTLINGSLRSSRRHDALELPCSTIVHLRRDLDGPALSTPEPRAATLARLLSSRLEPAPLLGKSQTEKLVAWLETQRCVSLRAPDAASAVRLLTDLLP